MLYEAQRTVETIGLGPKATDEDIYDCVRTGRFVLVTQNGIDFARLAIERGHIPVIVLPSGQPPQRQRAMLRHVAPIAEKVFARRQDVFVELKENGQVFSYRIRPGMAWKARLTGGTP